MDGKRTASVPVHHAIGELHAGVENLRHHGLFHVADFPVHRRQLVVRAVVFVECDHIGIVRNVRENAFVVEDARKRTDALLQCLASHLLAVLHCQLGAHAVEQTADGIGSLLGQKLVVEVKGQVFAIAGKQVARLVTKHIDK